MGRRASRAWMAKVALLFPKKRRKGKQGRRTVSWRLAYYRLVLPAVAIALGDPSGIGPEISLKAALDPAVKKMCRPILVGDRRVLEVHARACNLATDGIEMIERRQLDAS